MLRPVINDKAKMSVTNSLNAKIYKCRNIVLKKEEAATELKKLMETSLLSVISLEVIREGGDAQQSAELELIATVMDKHTNSWLKWILNGIHQLQQKFIELTFPNS
jgi:hypothetical protein